MITLKLIKFAWKALRFSLKSIVLFMKLRFSLKSTVLFMELHFSLKSTVLFMELRFSLKSNKKQLIQHRSLIMTWCFIEYRGKANWVYLTFWWYLVVHVCVYGACMHTYVSSFVLYDFIMDSMKSQHNITKTKIISWNFKWLHEIQLEFTKSNKIS